MAQFKCHICMLGKAPEICSSRSFFCITFFSVVDNNPQLIGTIEIQEVQFMLHSIINSSHVEGKLTDSL